MWQCGVLKVCSVDLREVRSSCYIETDFLSKGVNIVIRNTFTNSHPLKKLFTGSLGHEQELNANGKRGEGCAE